MKSPKPTPQTLQVAHIHGRLNTHTRIASGEERKRIKRGESLKIEIEKNERERVQRIFPRD